MAVQTLSRPAPADRELPVEPVGARLARLERETALPGWDGPRSCAIPAADWARARDFIAVAAAEVPRSGVPFVSPDTGGSIHLRWSAPGKRLDVEFADDGVFFSEWVGEARRASGEASLRDLIGRMRILFC